MEQIQPFITPIVIVVSIIGMVLYLRAENRANCRAIKADIIALTKEVASINALISHNRVVTTQESKADEQDAKIGALSQQMQHNHQDLLVRLAFHHHGDGRYPVAPSSEPNPAFPAGGDA